MKLGIEEMKLEVHLIPIFIFLIILQVLEAHGLKPIVLKPKEVKRVKEDLLILTSLFFFF